MRKPSANILDGALLDSFLESVKKLPFGSGLRRSQEFFDL
jgi:hypothetical protein